MTDFGRNTRAAACWPIPKDGDTCTPMFPDGSRHTFRFTAGKWVELTAADLLARRIAALRVELAAVQREAEALARTAS